MKRNENKNFNGVDNDGCAHCARGLVQFIRADGSGYHVDHRQAVLVCSAPDAPPLPAIVEPPSEQP